MIDFLVYSFKNINLFIPNLSELLAFIGLIQFLLVSVVIGTRLTPYNKLISISFFIGYGFIYLITVIFYVFFSIEVKKVYYIILFCSFIILFINKDLYKQKLKYILSKIFNNKLAFFCILPLFIILFNSKGIGWDVFSHWLPLANALNTSSEFLLRGHATNYPFASSIVLVFSSLYNETIQENISALFSLVQLIFVFELILFSIRKQKINQNDQIIKIFLIIIIFFSPIHMNKFVFTSYVDFDTAVATLFFVFLLYHLKIEPQNKDILLQLSLIGCLIVGLKNTGIVIIFFSLFSFVLILFYENFLSTIKKYFLPLLVLTIPILFSWSAWQYLLFTNDMMEKFIVYDYLRYELLKPFFKSIFFQISERKFFYFFSFLIVILFFFKKKLFKNNNQIIFFISHYTLFFIFWTFFLIITYIFHFNSGILDNATSFWRYNFQTSIFLLLIFCSLFFLLLENTKFLDIKKFKNLIILFIIILPIVFLYKFRRDLEPRYLTINQFQNIENNINSALVISEDSTYNAVRLNFYLNNDYRKSIVDSIEISKNNEKNELLFLNSKNNYDLILLLDQNDLLNFKKKIYFKK